MLKIDTREQLVIGDSRQILSPGELYEGMRIGLLTLVEEVAERTDDLSEALAPLWRGTIRGFFLPKDLVLVERTAELESPIDPAVGRSIEDLPEIFPKRTTHELTALGVAPMYYEGKDVYHPDPMHDRQLIGWVQNAVINLD